MFRETKLIKVRVETIQISIGWKKQMYLHLIGYYAATKRDELLIHAVVWANPERILISERNW